MALKIFKLQGNEIIIIIYRSKLYQRKSQEEALFPAV